MSRRMLIDATHPEETRVVVINGNKLEEFDFETSTKKQIKGNIYLAKITRVEPSLQAAFVEYGGNRHGFLSFSEIHPDYYRIPVADREAMEAEEQAAAEASEAADADDEPEDAAAPESPADHSEDGLSAEDEAVPLYAETHIAEPRLEEHADEAAADGEPDAAEFVAETDDETEASVPVDTLGGDDLDEIEPAPRVRHYRSYKIQEVIKRRQILLVQVTKEERGTKGAALTTYLSLAGRYCVLMPNAGRGGGVSRKITSLADRRRLRELMDELDVPEGMGVIVRTAGSERSQTEIKRDYEYLLRLWDDIRDLTLRSSAPALIYEEGNLIKRAIRDLFTRDIEEILVEGRLGYRAAKDFMRMLAPGQSDRVREYLDPAIPLLHRFQVDAQIDQIHSPVVQLKSGGYIVINPTEALVSIDVNSGRATRERNIEETATKTNIEAAEEIARQLRLRDLAGLVVIDFIDMEETRNQRVVEHRMKDAMKSDRARIQVGRISAFGLLELSRQRLRSSLIEASTQPCPHCNGTGNIRSTESTSLVVLRALEDEGIRRRTAEITLFVPTQIALYLLNQKRQAVTQVEQRYGFRVTVGNDDTLIPPAYRLERLRNFTAEEIEALPTGQRPEADSPDDDVVTADFLTEDDAAERDETTGSLPKSAGESGEGGGRRRRRKRRRRPGDAAQAGEPAEELAQPPEAESETQDEAASPDELAAQPTAGGEGDNRKRRRGRRGGRRRRREEGEPLPPQAVEAEAEDDLGYRSPFDFASDGRIEPIYEPLPDAKTEETEPAAIAETVVPEPEPAAEIAGAPKRRRAPRRAAAETDTAPEIAADEPAPKPRRSRKKAAEAASAEPSEPVEADDPIPAPTETESDQPRKTGWWRRLVS